MSKFKVGKNAPCPCGSGLKAKKCSHKNASSPSHRPRQNNPEVIWQLEYRFKRYLQHLSEDDLTNRGIEIVSNLPKPREVKFGISHNCRNLGYWMKLLVHVSEEFRLRKTNVDFLDKQIEQEIARDSKRASIEDKVQIRVEKLNLKPGGYLLKYGKQRYISPMSIDGSIRISPASTYNDSSLNSAIQDNELENSVLVTPDEVKYEEFYKKIKVTVGEKSGYLGDFAEFVGNSKFTRVCNKDFFVFCLCFEHSLRMFEDFEADSCLLITKPEIFLQKVISGFENEFPNAQHYNAQIKYYDPIVDKLHSFPPYFSKHFKYYYQNEYRMIWLPSSDLSSDRLDHVSLKLGSLAECSELININNHD